MSVAISEADHLRRESGTWLVTRRMGCGGAIPFASDPLFLFFWRATQPLLLSALMLDL